MTRLALALSLLLLASRAGAEEQPQWTVQVDPLTTLLGFAHVQVERAVAPEFSIYAGPHLKLYDNLLSGAEESFVGFGGELGGRWFFRGVAPEGAWVMARAVLARVSTEAPAPQARLGGYGSALVGYTAIFGAFVLSGGAGVQYLDYGIAGEGTRGVLPALHTALGVAF
jgi:hypothetical protein